jgi:hypothetical protein
MAYLLLWSAIERYVSLRYYLAGDKVNAKVKHLAEEPAFGEGLRRYVKKKSRPLYRADDPHESLTLDPESPKKSLYYYSQVRSNITHRGKGVVSRDHRLVMNSLMQLLPIFREVLQAAQSDAESSA